MASLPTVLALPTGIIQPTGSSIAPPAKAAKASAPYCCKISFSFSCSSLRSSVSTPKICLTPR